MTNPKTIEIKRSPLLCSHSLRGFYRYKDLFQLVPPIDSDPTPDQIAADYGLTIEFAVDTAVGDRELDIWAHDHRERIRFEHLRQKIKKPSSDSWFETDELIRVQKRPAAIAHEIVRLLSLLTNYSFREANSSDKVWVLDDLETGKARYVQRWYPSFATGSISKFTMASGSLVPLVDPGEYYDRVLGYGPEDPIIEFPSDIDDRIGLYLRLPSARQMAMSRAMELLGVATETWRLSRSVSLAAAVFAVEALIHADDPSPQRCSACNNLSSSEHCEECGAPKYGLTRKFRNFLDRFAKSDTVSANRLYSARSDIAHSGRLLRSDEFDSGFSLGNKDNQSELEYKVTLSVRHILINWLSSQAS